MEYIEQTEIDGLTVTVEYDQTPTISPREDCDNLGAIWIHHRRYSSPDYWPGSDLRDAINEIFPNRAKLNFGSTLQDALAVLRRHCIALPVWLYDHSGTCYKAAEENPFHCPWDSGFVGFVFVRKEIARKEFGRLNAANTAKVLDVLKAEVDTYSAWANGEVYCYRITDEDGEELDSCYGFIGDSDYAFAEGCDAAKAMTSNGLAA